jgi:hypothetical protein
MIGLIILSNIINNFKSIITRILQFLFKKIISVIFGEIYSKIKGHNTYFLTI